MACKGSGKKKRKKAERNAKGGINHGFLYR